MGELSDEEELEVFDFERSASETARLTHAVISAIAGIFYFVLLLSYRPASHNANPQCATNSTSSRALISAFDAALVAARIIIYVQTRRRQTLPPFFITGLIPGHLVMIYVEWKQSLAMECITAILRRSKILTVSYNVAGAFLYAIIKYAQPSD